MKNSDVVILFLEMICYVWCTICAAVIYDYDLTRWESLIQNAFNRFGKEPLAIIRGYKRLNFNWLTIHSIAQKHTLTLSIMVFYGNQTIGKSERILPS